jgi:putative ABC transport system permease protein
VLKAVRLPPAEAMRPEPPGIYRPTLVERIGLGGLFTPPWMIILRNIERRPFRAVFSLLGISLSVAILVMGFFFEDAINFIIEIQFNVAGREDAVVSFVEHQPARARFEIARLPGVMQSEPFRSVPVRIRFGHRSRQASLLGLEPEAALRRVVDENGRVVPIPEEGLVMSRILAENLRLEPGDLLTIEVLEGARLTHEVPVVGLVDDMIGVSLYMDLHSLNRLMREGGTISGAFLSLDDRYAGELYNRVKGLPQVAGMTLTRASIESFEDTLKENMLIFATVLIVFAMIITGGVVYNSARVALSERSRELASLRVMGFTRAEISMILLGELTVLTLAAIPFGFLLGYLLSWWICHVYTTELYRIPVYIEQSTYAIAAAIVLAASVLTALAVRRKLDRLDLVAVLKIRE